MKKHILIGAFAGWILGLANYALIAQSGSPQLPGKEAQSKLINITGCLTALQSPEPQYILKVAEGRVYPLDPGDVDLRAHLGHTVTISGSSMARQGPHDQDRIRVHTLLMVSTMCNDHA